jgi:hypothetical protein
MNKKRKLILGSALGVATIITAGAFIGDSVNAYRGDYTQKGPDYTVERHEQMEVAFENNDYNAWKELMNSRGRVTQVINEQNFQRFVEAHKLAEQGDYDGADKIREELGLRTKNGESKGQGFGNKGNGQRQGTGEGQGRWNE